MKKGSKTNYSRVLLAGIILTVNSVNFMVMGTFYILKGDLGVGVGLIALSITTAAAAASMFQFVATQISKHRQEKLSVASVAGLAILNKKITALEKKVDKILEQLEKKS
jgi:predicted MFS family arabinose efflux permease